MAGAAHNLGEYDAIVVGARIAGSTLAMMLGDRGWRVLLLDRSTFPSDTLSTHVAFQDTFAIWDDLGVMEDVEAIGAPHLMRMRRWAPASIEGRFLPVGRQDYAMCLRRIKLDEILVRHAGKRRTVDVQPASDVEQLIWEDGRVVGVTGRRTSGAREPFTARAKVVVGADGRISHLAKLVESEFYHCVPPLNFCFYAYWRGVEPFGRPYGVLETYESEPADATAIYVPTDDDLWLAVLFIAQDQFESFRRGHEANYLARWQADPMLAARLKHAERVSPVRGRGDFANFFRQSYGPGWALVGDAGSFKDAVVGQGFGDAARSCVILATALDRAFKGDWDLTDALDWYQRERDFSLLPNFERLTLGAPLGVSKEDYARFLVCVSQNDALSDQFVAVLGKGVNERVFFSPEHVQKVIRELGPTALKDESILTRLGRLGR
jgi:flavin-dependent dehydrogenase